MTRVDICVCTFRRASLVDTLASLMTLDLPGDVEARVIVVDNDTTPSAQTAVTHFAASAKLPVRYLHRPAGNISIARNGALDASDARFVAFIDDDETAQAVIEQQSFHVFTEHTLGSADALRAELKDIRQNGYGFDREEHEPGIICVAMPILTDTGRVLGALSVTSTTSRTNLAGLEAFVPVLKETADKITRDAQNWSFPDYNAKETTGI